MNSYFDIPQAEINATVNRNYGRRRRREAVFRGVAVAAIFMALAVLAALLGSTILQARGALWQSEIRLAVTLDADTLGIADNDPETLQKGDYSGAIKQALRQTFPDVTGRGNRRSLYKLISTTAAFELLERIQKSPQMFGATHEIWLLAGGQADTHIKSGGKRTAANFTDKQKQWLAELQEDGRIRTPFNHRFFLRGDSREAEAAGIAGALIGSAWMIFVTLALSFPLGVMAAVYLQEFAPKNRINDFIEININTLASVPSIVFGLLGLAAFIEFFGMPRSAPVTGGLVLALMTLPVIIIATRSSLQTVPPSIREAALAMGASRMQMILHHVLPLSLPGIFTGSIIGISRALGETAPLLMIGMVAFIIDIPTLATDPATALPVQIFIWADHPERAFLERTALAILVLLVFLALINSTAVILRRKFTRKW